MTQVNLLPVEVHERVKNQRLTLAIAAAAGATLILLGLVFVLQAGRLAAADRQLADRQATNNRLQGQIASLQRYKTLAEEVSSARTLVAEVTQGQIMWSGVLRDLSLVVPADRPAPRPRSRSRWMARSTP